MMQRIYIEKDGIPFVDATTKTVIFGTGERSIEYTWEEIKEVIENDYEQWGRSPHNDIKRRI